MVILGNLRYPIQILSKSTTIDEYGAESITWNSVMSLKAGVTYGKGKKGVEDKEVFSHQLIIFQTHYRPIQTNNRILFNGNKYLIEVIDVIGNYDGLNIHAELIIE